MTEKIGSIKNPLTIIAIFAGIAEVSGTAVLPFLSGQNQSVFVWFLMGFPTFLVALFFFTLHKNHRILYAPSDYENQEHFMEPHEREKLDKPASTDAGGYVVKSPDHTKHTVRIFNSSQINGR